MSVASAYGKQTRSQGVGKSKKTDETRRGKSHVGDAGALNDEEAESTTRPAVCDQTGLLLQLLHAPPTPTLLFSDGGVTC